MEDHDTYEWITRRWGEAYPEEALAQTKSETWSRRSQDCGAIIEAWASNDPEAAFAYLYNEPQPGMAFTNYFSYVIDAVGATDFTKANNLAKKLGRQCSFFSAQAWMREEPEVTIKRVAEEPETMYRNQVLAEAFGAWLENSPDQAVDWLAPQALTMREQILRVNLERWPISRLLAGAELILEDPHYGVRRELVHSLVNRWGLL